MLFESPLDLPRERPFRNEADIIAINITIKATARPASKISPSINQVRFKIWLNRAHTRIRPHRVFANEFGMFLNCETVSQFKIGALQKNASFRVGAKKSSELHFSSMAIGVFRCCACFARQFRIDF
jgi:hypothetical protein